MAELTSDQVRNLETTRQSLSALHKQLVALGGSLAAASPIPPFPEIQNQAQSITTNFQNIAAQLSEHQSTMNSTVAFPLPAFGHPNSGVLQVLLRTKLEPSTENWIKEGESLATQQRKPGSGGLSDEARLELWQWAPGAANAQARRQAWGADYTRAEVEAGVAKVVTGLRRELVEPPELDDEAEDDDDDDEYDSGEDEDEPDDEPDEMSVDGITTKPESKPSTTKPVTSRVATQVTPLASIHKFMTTGT